MQQYELAVLLHPDLEIDIQTPLERLEKDITGSGGKIIKRDDWGKRKLAYPINKHTFAIYFFYILETEPNKVDALEQSLRLNNEVIRHLIVKFDPSTETDDEDEEGDSKKTKSVKESKSDTSEDKAKETSKDE
ncbi:MAG: 30S ribosomal protein S6 [Candidatus Saccharimonadales bacterium]